MSLEKNIVPSRREVLYVFHGINMRNNCLGIIRVDRSSTMVAQIRMPVMPTLRSEAYFAQITIIPLIDSAAAAAA